MIRYFQELKKGDSHLERACDELNEAFKALRKIFQYSKSDWLWPCVKSQAGQLITLSELANEENARSGLSI